MQIYPAMGATPHRDVHADEPEPEADAGSSFRPQPSEVVSKAKAQNGNTHVNSCSVGREFDSASYCIGLTTSGEMPIAGDPNSIMFERSTLEAARSSNLSCWQGWSSDERFQVETEIVLQALDPILQQAHNVLDFGIGVGRLSRTILERYPQVSLIGVDNSESQLTHAREYIPQRFFEEGRMTLVPAYNLNHVSNGSIDLALAVYVLQYVDSHLLDPVLEHLHRVLKENGKLFVLNSKVRTAVRNDQPNLAYRTCRRLAAGLERFAGQHWVQRLFGAMDSHLLLQDDGIDVARVLDKRFRHKEALALDGPPQFTRLMQQQFAGLYW